MATAGHPGRLRVGDAEREAAAAALGEHFTAGRLTLEEFDSRTSAAYAAKTRADLDALFADLPMLHLPVVPPPPARVARRRTVPMPVIVLAAVVVLPGAFFLLHVPWLLIPLFVVIGRSRWRHQRGGRPGPGTGAGGYGPAWGQHDGHHGEHGYHGRPGSGPVAPPRAGYPGRPRAR